MKCPYCGNLETETLKIRKDETAYEYKECNEKFTYSPD